jgi:hypothetical protein
VALVLPQIEDITDGSNGFDIQAVEDTVDGAAQAGVTAGNYVVTGCAVTPQGSPNMTVAVAAGTVVINGTTYTISANGAVTVGAASASDRRDIITVNTAGTISCTAGTACGTAGWVRTTAANPPVKPSIPANSVILAEVVVKSSTTSIAAINITDKRPIGGATPGTLIARAQYSPAVAGSYTLVVATTGLTALDSTNLKVTFVAPASGAVKVRLQGFVQGPAAAGTKTIFGIVSTTASPGTVVGVTGLVNLSPTATATYDGVICTMEQTITGLTPGTSYTWYFAGMYSGTASKVIPQGATAQTTVPTGAPASMEVWAA